MRDFMKPACTDMDQEWAQGVEVELIRLLYRQVPVALITTLCAIVIPVCVLWPIVSHTTLLVWACGVNIIGLLGLGLFWRYPHQASPMTLSFAGALLFSSWPPSKERHGEAQQPSYFLLNRFHIKSF